MRALGNWTGPVIVTLMTVAMLAVLVRLFESRLAFFPFAGEDVTPRAFGIEYTPLTIETADGERLRAWHLPRDNPRARVIYFHGNGGNLSVWADVYVGLWEQGFDITAVDYRGYGASTGRPSEQGLYRDVEATIAAAPNRSAPPDAPLVYWGRSLGTPMAAYAASRRPPDGIVLEAGFPSARNVLQSHPLMWVMSWASSYRFPTAEWMAGVQRPTLVLHGERDEVVPFRSGQKLFELLPEPKTFVAIPGGGHNESVPRQSELYWRAIHDFVSRLGREHAAARS